MLTNIINSLIDKPLRSIIGVLLLTILCGIGFKNAGFDNNYKTYFKSDNPQMVAFDKLERLFPSYENILIVFTPAGDLFSRSNLSALSELTIGAWQIPDSKRVDSIINFQYSYAQGEDFVIEDLFGDLSNFSDDDLIIRRSIALKEPALVNLLLAGDARAAGVNIETVVDPSNPMAGYNAVKAARELARNVEHKYPGVRIDITGNIALNNAFLESTISDFQSIMPLMYLLLVIMSYLILRSFFATILVMSVVLLATVIGLGIPSWLGIQLTTPSSIAPNIIMTLAIADSIHIILAYSRERNAGVENMLSIQRAISKTFRPVVLTSVTTAIGFLSMNFSESPPFNDLGNITAIGVIAALFLTFTLIPAALALRPIQSGSERFSASFMGSIADFVLVNKVKILILFPLFAIVLSSFSSRIELNDSYVDFFDNTVEFRRATVYAEENLSGIFRIDYALFSEGKEQVITPEYLNNVEKFALWLEDQPEVMHVARFPTILKRINQNMNSDDDAYYAIPGTRELNAQYLLLYELSLPFGRDIASQVAIDKSSTKVTATLHNIKAKSLREFEERSYAWTDANLPSYMNAVGGSANLMFAHISLHNIQGMIFGTLLALILISAILVLFLKSYRFGLISIIPNLIPACMAFGIWGIAVGEVGMVASTVIALTLGIVVDDTIHFISGFIHCLRNEQMSPEQAIRSVFISTGPALTANTIILSVGFLVLAQSTFAINAVMGLLSAMTIIIALLADFLLLPPLLLLICSKKHILAQK